MCVTTTFFKTFRSQNAYYSLVNDCEFTDESKLTLAEVGMIFVKVNLEEGDKNSAENKLNDEHSLMRHEFIEALLRIAGAEKLRETCASWSMLTALLNPRREIWPHRI